MKLIQVSKNVEFTRVGNDYYGNPRFAFHYLALSDEYQEALLIAKQFGGKKYHNRKFGGGIVIQSFNLVDSLQDIQKSVIEHQAGIYTTYLLECFDCDDNLNLEDKIKKIKRAYLEEFAHMGCNVQACNAYLRGLGGDFNHAFDNAEIEALGRKRFKALRKNASVKNVCQYVSSVYWDKLAQGLLVLLSIEFV